MDEHIGELFPGLHIISGSGSTLTSSDGEEYLSFFTDSLRWLCGYDNARLNERLNGLITRASSNELTPGDITDKLADQLLSHTPGLSSAAFTENDIYAELAPLLENGEKKLFLVIGTMDPNIPEQYKSRFIDYRQAAAKEDPGEQFTAVLSQKTLQKVFKRYKGRLAGVILTIEQPAAANFIASESALLVQKHARRARVPFILDERSTSPYRTGTFFASSQFSLEPDIITGGGRLYGNRRLYFALMTRKYAKKKLKPLTGIPQSKTLANCLMLTAIISELETMDLPRRITELNHRLVCKLRALEANSGGHFTYRSFGSLFYLNLKQNALAKRTYEYLFDEKILLEPDASARECLIIAPPLTFSGFDIDSLIDALDDFFKNGIRLPSKRPHQL